MSRRYPGGIISANRNITTGSSSGMWTVPQQSAEQQSGRWGGDEKIPRSVRLNTSDSAYFDYVPGTSGNQTTWTFSAWIKRGVLGTEQRIFCAAKNSDSADNPRTDFAFLADGTLNVGFNPSGTWYNALTNQVFRDTSAWYHLVLAVDTTQQVAANRFRLYVNGVEIVSYSSNSLPSINKGSNVVVNRPGYIHRIGNYGNVSQNPLNGYIAEVNFVDGLQLSPGALGAIDYSTGVWRPKKYKGEYGTNGFYLPFDNNASAAHLGLSQVNLNSGDDYWPYTTLLLKTSGSNTAQNNNFVDSSSYNASITRVGNVQQGRFSPFSDTGWSGYFDGSSDGITLFSGGDNPDFHSWLLQTTSTRVGTIEAWIYLQSHSSPSVGTGMYTHRSILGRGATFMNFGVRADGRLRFYWYNNGTDQQWVETPTNSIQLHRWHHVAAVFNNGNCYLFVDGTPCGGNRISNGSDQGSPSFNGVAAGTFSDGAIHWIGRESAQPATSTWHGYINNLRITNGVALYNERFIPSAENLTAFDTSVKLLTLQDARFADRSSNNRTLTPLDTTAIHPFAPKSTNTNYTVELIGGSAYFDGSGDRLTIPDSDNFSFGTGNYTVEAWVWPLASGNTSNVILNQSNGGAGSDSSFYLGFATDGVSHYVSDGTGWDYNASVGSKTYGSQWNHVVWMRNGDTLYTYVNGALEASTALSAGFALGNSSRVVEVASQNGEQYFKGYIANLRVTKGFATYQTYSNTFTPPTRPVGGVGVNLLPQSEDLTFPNWYPLDINVKKTSIPNHANTATAFIATEGYGASTYHSTFAQTNYSVSGTYAYSIYAKAATGNFITISMNRGVAQNYVSATFNLATGAVATSAAGSSNGTVVSTAITSAGGGWYRCVLVGTLGSVNYVNIGMSNSASPSYDDYGRPQYTGAGKSIYIWGPQVESGSSATTYTPTPTTSPSERLLLNFANSNIYDATGRSTIETVDGAQIVTATKKYDVASVVFDGSGDFLKLAPIGTGDFGTGDFTVEYWARNDSTQSMTNYSSQVGTLVDATPANSWRFGTFSSSGRLCFPVHDGSSFVDYYFGSTNYNDNTWRHYAVSRRNGTVKAFVDGVQVGSDTTITTNLTNNKWVTVGAETYSPTYYKGHIEDLRITKGVARYNGSFVPPERSMSRTVRDLAHKQVHAVNVSVDAGVGNDSMLESPTGYGVDTGLGGEIRGNYCTMNPLTASTSTFTLSNGNLEIADNNTSAPVALGTLAVSSGKWYWEVQIGSSTAYPGFATVESRSSVSYLGAVTGQSIYNTGSTSSSIVNGNFTDYTTASTAGPGDIIGVALDFDTNTVVFYKNGVSQGVFGSNLLTGNTIAPAFKSNTVASAKFNFGQRPFAYPAPSGFKTLCVENLPTTIGNNTTSQADSNFDTVLYTGNGSSQTITGLDFQPDLIWIKRRDGSGQDHVIMDSIRGFTSATKLSSSSSAAENNTGGGVTDPQWGYVSGTTSNGFTVTVGSGAGDQVNRSSYKYVAWCWKAGNSVTTNSSGTITSQTSVNSTAGFSIVTYTGTGVNATVGHGLGATPGLILLKNRDNGTRNWPVWHGSFAVREFMYLSTNGAKASDISTWGTVNSTVFTLGDGSTPNTSWNELGAKFVAYCWTSVPGFSRFGTYIGNGSADGTFVYTGFEPAFVLMRDIGNTNSWILMDNKRTLPYNPQDGWLVAHATDGEYNVGTSDSRVDFLSNGFKLRNTNSGNNGSGRTYVYAAFAESPFKYSRAR